MQTNLIDQVLTTAKRQSLKLFATMREGGTLTFKIKDFDQYVLLVEGEPDYLLYRHSILQVNTMTEGGRRQTPPAPVPRKNKRPDRPSEARERSKTGGKPAPKRSAKPDRARTPSKQKPVETVPDNREQDFGNPMAEKLKKWLDSHKDRD